MPNGEFQPPPTPSLPEKFAWEDMKLIGQKLDELINLTKMSLAPAPPAAYPTTVVFPKGLSAQQQLVMLLQQLAPETLGASAIIPFQKTVAVAYQDEQERQVPFSGIINEVLMGFPAGCHQLVEVRLIYFPTGGGKKYVIPTLEDSFIALDDVTVLFRPRYPVKAPGQLRVEWYNYDSLNTHTVLVIATVSPTGLGVS